MWNMGEKGALVVAGAVARGAFEAGVTSELSARGLVFDRFVGASAGALNATLLAAGAAVGRPCEAAAKLEGLWRDHAGLFDFVRFPKEIAQGLSSTRGIAKLVHDALAAIVGDRPPSLPAATTLTLIATDLRGFVTPEGELTYEDDHVFDARALVDRAHWPRIARVAAASAAFPFFFVPPRFGDGAQRVDGGAVNNAPISYVIEERRGRNQIVVVSAEAPSPRPQKTLRVAGLVSRLAQIVVNERLGRDLTVAKKRNADRRELLAALERENVSPERAAALADRLGFRHLELLTVRPSVELAGGPFLGFLWKPTRERQILAGKAAAAAALAAASRQERASPFTGPEQVESRRQRRPVLMRS
jgi:NTE family protein